MNKTEPQYGPYLADGREYNLAPLTTRRYQAFLRVFTSLPLTTLYQAWADFQEALQAKVPEDLKDRLAKGELAEADLVEVTLTDADMAPLGAAVFRMVIQADEEDVLVGLLAIAIGIDQEEAADIHYKVMVEAVGDFFTANPSLLPDSVRFLTGMMNPLSRGLPTLGTSRPQRPSSTSGSTPSQPKPERSPAGEIPEKRNLKEFPATGEGTSL